MDKLYSLKYKKWFMIHHLPFLINEDIGINGNRNIPIPLSEIGKTFLTEDQYK